MRCWRCGGTMLSSHGDVTCINCGASLYPPKMTLAEAQRDRLVEKIRAKRLDTSNRGNTKLKELRMNLSS